MKSQARSLLKRLLPARARSLVWKMRSAVAPPPIDEVVLQDFAIAADDCDRPRLTLVVPLLQKGADFGGMATGLEIFFRLFAALEAKTAADVRVIVTDVVAETDPGIVTSRAQAAGVSLSADSIVLAKESGEPLPVRRREVFVTYNWWTTINFAKLRNMQTELFGQPAKPMVWLMQDYEPAFMGFSSGHMLARAAYETSSPLWGVINSSNLAAYMEAVGQSPDRSFVFEPVVSEKLRPYLGEVSSSQRTKRMLVYGRPTVERNCFTALIRGLRHWVESDPQAQDWEIVSAGMPHDPVDLGSGRKLVSLGKLSLDEYAQTLLGSSVGVSLMASPHPSYPPLEMAHFGLQTVTNGYACKNLDTYHPNIISTPSVAKEALAEAISEACRRSAESPSDYQNPAYLREEDYPFLPDLCEALLAELA